MKVSLDLDKLLETDKITQAEYDKLKQLAAESSSTLAFNILIGFGVIAVGAAALSIVPSAITAIVLGCLIFGIGLTLSLKGSEQWSVLATICMLIGALMAGAGLITIEKGSLLSFIVVTLIFAVASIFAHSALLAVLATLSLSACIGARTGYFHASYFLIIREPVITIVLFTGLAIALYQLSKQLSADLSRLAIAAARTCLLMINFGFWVGSLWGDKPFAQVVIADWIFALLWALALLLTGVWAWQQNRPWVLNTVAIFGGIHFYTQWFEYLGATPGTVLLAGLTALGFALGLHQINRRLKQANA